MATCIDDHGQDILCSVLSRTGNSGIKLNIAIQCVYEADTAPAMQSE